MKVKNTLSFTIGAFSFAKTIGTEGTPSEEKVTFNDVRMDVTVDEELSDAEFEANMKFASMFMNGLATAVPAVIKAVGDIEAEKARLRHYHKVEEMKLQDQLDAAKHQRIQESKGGKPLTAEEIKDLIRASNKDLVEKLTTTVRITRTP